VDVCNRSSRAAYCCWHNRSKKVRRVIRALGVKNLQLYADAPRGAWAAGKQQCGEHNEKQQSD